MFAEEEIAIDEGLGYPKLYAKLCRDRSFRLFSHGPPFNFMPYALGKQEDLMANEFVDMFPIINSKAKPTTKPKMFVSLLWKQLNHLGNAGFDPEIFRVDPYGNVLYYHADAASPLSWDIDHWFPLSRGGLTVPSNLRILQWQVCKRKHNKLEFLIPWWDFQVGISINQFLSIFASSNSDFRHRAFSWLFYDGEREELNESQTMDSHIFPQHFIESKAKLGLAPAAIILSRRESFDAPFKSLDINQNPTSRTLALKKIKQTSKENEDPLRLTYPYEDSLRQEEATKMQAEIRKLDDEVNELQRKTEEDRVSIDNLESVLIKKKRRVEKCRRFAEEQNSYRAMLEKMIRDAMHQSVLYKEQMRLNQAAATSLYARLEAQRAICDSAERELHNKNNQRDELEKKIRRPELEKARKRARIYGSLDQENDDKMTPLYLTEKDQKFGEITDKKVPHLSEIEPHSVPIRKELRKFLEEDQKASAESSLINEKQDEEDFEGCKEIITGDNIKIDERYEKLEIEDGGIMYNIRFPFHHDPEKEDDEESRKQRGKINVEKWLQFMLENTQAESQDDEKTKGIVEIEENGEKNNLFKNPPYRIGAEKIEPKELVSIGNKHEGRFSDASVTMMKKNGKEGDVVRSESARVFRRIPSSPSLMLKSMKKRVDCMGKKPLVLDDDY